MSKKVVVYSNVGCGQCRGAKMFLDSKGIEYEERNVSEDPKFMEQYKEHGVTSVPLIVCDGFENIVGFNSTKLAELASFIEDEETF